MSRSGCVTEPGYHVSALLPESSESEWREPIKNGNVPQHVFETVARVHLDDSLFPENSGSDPIKNGSTNTVKSCNNRKYQYCMYTCISTL